MSIIGTVSFSVDGKWLTDFIRGRYLNEGMDFSWVVETISESLKGNGLSEQRILGIAQDIILGRSYFKGNTADGSFVYCDGSDEPVSSDFFEKYSKLQEELNQERQARKDAVEAWQELALVYTDEMRPQDCECKCNIDLLKPTSAPTPVQEFIERTVKPEEEVAPYGFISPDGEFHPVKWADHEEFACNFIEAHGGWQRILDDGQCDTAKDFIILRLGWLLLHNPRQGKPFLTSGDKPMTKAQRETLYDYYTKYGMKEEANALYKEGDFH